MQYILVGYPFAGKTVLAKKLEKELGFTRLSVDDVKFEFGYINVNDNEIPDEAWKKIFEELDKRVKSALQEGDTVLNEYAWINREWRDRARKLASDLGIDSKIIYVNTPVDIVKQRWQENRKTKDRFDVPDDVFEEAITEFEEPSEEENVIQIKPEDNIDRWVAKEIKSE